VLATSWNILSGYTGYFSFGHGAFFGAGLYTTSTLLARYEWPFLWTLPVAALVAAALGVALGAVVMRVPAVTDLDRDPLEVIETGDWVTVNGDAGTVEVRKREAR